MRSPLRAVSTLVLFVLIAATAFAQVQPELLQTLKWRNIGPYRGGRTKTIVGVPGQPNVFYIGVVNGGVWKTDDFGRTWRPIFDSEPTGSIGTIAIAGSDPNIIYVGSGEGLHRPDLSVGNGIYKSTDGGKNWTHLGLRDGQQIPQIAIDPRNADHILVAVAGHPYGPNEERGIFRSTDGGKTFTKTLYKDENVGGADVKMDPSNPDTVYAALWESREGPWENAAWNGTGGGIYKSTDGGQTWNQLKGGLPEGIIQSWIAIAPSNPKRLMATVATQGKVQIYRSDDAGANWAVITTDPRPAGRIGGGDLSVPRFDPKNPDVVIVTSTVTWRSVDGGKTWEGFRGAPGGDDYQNSWINPDNPNIIGLASDQGAIITVNNGQTWSSWYNQSTAQMYHANADNAFPYRVCSGQQESGSACVSSRGNDGAITFRDWHPVAAEEYGYVVPDPQDPDIVYGGKLTRYDRRTDQAQEILPKAFRGGDFRVVRTQPIVFSPKNPSEIYFAANTLWKTTDAGKNWKQVSPDFTRKEYELPASIGKYKDQPTAKPTQRGVIYAVSVSPLEDGRIWAGTDDGLIHLTTDGGANWTDVTPPQLKPWAKVSIIDAGHFDANTAYAAINTLRLDDLHPHILRTHDSGKTWTEIVNGIGADEDVNAVREDPVRKGLLFASTERSVYVSFDDGDHWQSLRNNMPGSSVRDVIVKNDDLIAATHGRGFWIMDDITPLRQMAANVTQSEATLFRPANAVRVRWDMNTDTPLPPDEPQAANPPDGAIIDYYIKSQPSKPVTLQIVDQNTKVVRSYSSAEKPTPIDPMLPVPKYWVRPSRTLSAAPGMHRFLWDMHLNPIPGVRTGLPIAAVFENTAPSPTSPWVMPGQYTVILTVNGKRYTQPLTVTMDPRVKTPQSAIEQQFTLSEQLYNDASIVSQASEEVNSVRDQIIELLATPASSSVADSLKAFDQKLASLQGEGGGRGRSDGSVRGLAPMRGALLSLMGNLQGADVAPTSVATEAIATLHTQAPGMVAAWQQLKLQELPAINKQLEGAKLEPLKTRPKNADEVEIDVNRDEE